MSDRIGIKIVVKVAKKNRWYSRAWIFEELMRQWAENVALYVKAPETRFAEDLTNNWVIENRQNQVLSLDFDARHGVLVLRDLVVQNGSCQGATSSLESF